LLPMPFWVRALSPQGFPMGHWREAVSR
jgi:hypothetical protein